MENYRSIEGVKYGHLYIMYGRLTLSLFYLYY